MRIFGNSDVTVVLHTFENLKAALTCFAISFTMPCSSTRLSSQSCKEEERTYLQAVKAVPLVDDMTRQER